MAGKQSVFLLRLHNETDLSIPILKMTTSCGCLKANSLGNSIDPRASVDFNLIIDAPSRSDHVTQNQSFYIYYGDKQSVAVRTTFQLAGLFSFVNTAFMTKAPLGAREHTFRIPVIVTEPIRLADLVFRADESFGELTATLKEENGTQFLDCRVALTEDVGRSGIIELVHNKQAETRWINCVVASQQLVEFSPSIVRFSKVKDEESPTSFTGTCIVRLHPSMLQFTKTGGEVELLPSIELSAEGAMATVESTRLTKGTYRLKFKLSLTETVTGPTVSRLPDNLVLTVSSAGKLIRKTVEVKLGT